jgi:hypothetical protein
MKIRFKWLSQYNEIVKGFTISSHTGSKTLTISKYLILITWN